MRIQKKWGYISLLVSLAAGHLTTSCTHTSQQPVKTDSTQKPESPEKNPAPIEMAITVDDLPCYEDRPANVSCLTTARKLIAGFKKHNIPEVFGFVNAKSIADNVDGDQVMKEWLAAGFLLGSHTYSHPNVNDVSIAAYLEDIKKNEEILRKYTQSDSIKYFRYPYLAEGNTLERKKTVLDFLTKNNFKVAEISTDFSDWEWTFAADRCLKQKNTTAIAELEKSYLDAAKRELLKSVAVSNELFGRDIKHVLLSHIGYFSAEMIDRLLTQYEQMGVKFISLSEALQDPIYQQDYSTAVDVNGRTFLDMHLKKKGRSLDELKRFYTEKEMDIICPEK